MSVTLHLSLFNFALSTTQTFNFFIAGQSQSQKLGEPADWIGIRVECVFYLYLSAGRPELCLSFVQQSSLVS